VREIFGATVLSFRFFSGWLLEDCHLSIQLLDLRHERFLPLRKLDHRAQCRAGNVDEHFRNLCRGSDSANVLS
jgi:hypothetical protein